MDLGQFFIRFFFSPLCKGFSLDPAILAQIQKAKNNSTIIFVCSKSSFANDCLMNALALQQDIPPPKRFSQKALLSHKMFLTSVRDTKDWNALPSSLRSFSFVPTFISWGRNPTRSASPTFLQWLLVLWRSFPFVTFSLGKMIEGQTYSYSSSHLRRKITLELFRKRKLLTGPSLPSRRKLIREFLKDSEILSILQSQAKKRKKTRFQMVHKASKILRTLMANYKPWFLPFAYLGAHELSKKLFHQVWFDPKEIQNLKDLIQKHPVILIPCHRSHMDYLILSATFYENGICPPHIAAGINLSFFPMGTLFRWVGAYFIRRKLSSDPLYARLLALYLRWLIQKKFTQEFFMEGGRSRSGKILPPKHGLLSLEIEAFFLHATQDLFFVPVSFSYDRIPEEISFQNELQGKLKQKENLWTLLKARSLFRRSFGSVYVRLGTPLSMKEYFSPLGSSLHLPGIRRNKTVELAHEITKKISQLITATTSSLSACVFLSHPHPQISKNEFQEDMQFLIQYLSDQNFPLAPELQASPLPLSSLLGFLQEMEWIQPAPFSKEGSPHYFIQESKKTIMDFHKNTVLPYFLPLTIEALSTSQGWEKRSPEEIRSFLIDWISFEFIGWETFWIQTQVREKTWGIQKYFTTVQNRKWGRLLNSFLETYQVASQWALEKPVTFPLPSRQVEQIMCYGYQCLEKGWIHSPESISTERVKNSFQFLYKKGFLKDSIELQKWTKLLSEIRNINLGSRS